MNGIISPFQMKKNKVIKFKIVQNDNDLIYEEVRVNLGADYKISEDVVEDDKYLAKLDLLIELEGVSDQNEQIFNIRLDMMGQFIGNTRKLSKEKFSEMLKINGVSTLLQLSRAFVTSVSALSGFARPINFPMVNVFELNKLKEANEIEDS